MTGIYGVYIRSNYTAIKNMFYGYSISQRFKDKRPLLRKTILPSDTSPNKALRVLEKKSTAKTGHLCSDRNMWRDGVAGGKY